VKVCALPGFLPRWLGLCVILSSMWWHYQVGFYRALIPMREEIWP
jgi:hypothetical protein